MRTALVIIATGWRYWGFIEPLIKSAEEFFVAHEVLLFTDNPDFFGVKQVLTAHREWPYPTLFRYHIMLEERKWLKEFDQVFYIDADSKFISEVGEEIFSDGITAQIHPRLLGQRGTFETNPKSTAYVDDICNNPYYLGAFQGGQRDAFLTMAETIRCNIDLDLSWGYIAIWHDESHLNRYLLTNPPAKVLTIDYCYPEEWGKFEENSVKIISPEKDSAVYHGIR